MILQSLAGLPAFLVELYTGLVVSTRITRHDEFKPIRENVPAQLSH